MTETFEPDVQLSVGCPLDQVLKFLSREWTGHIIWALGHAGTLRFGALRRTLPGAVSAKVLAARLRELEAKGLIVRDDQPGRVPTVSYTLTSRGAQLHDVLVHMQATAGRLMLTEG